MVVIVVMVIKELFSIKFYSSQKTFFFIWFELKYTEFRSKALVYSLNKCFRIEIGIKINFHCCWPSGRKIRIFIKVKKEKKKKTFFFICMTFMRFVNERKCWRARWTKKGCIKFNREREKKTLISQMAWSWTKKPIAST